LKKHRLNKPLNLFIFHRSVKVYLLLLAEKFCRLYGDFIEIGFGKFCCYICEDGGRSEYL